MSEEMKFTEEAPSLISVGASAIVDNAERLGLTWNLRYGTVTSATPLAVTYDGDTEAIPMTSLVGVLNAGDRVSCIAVPPSGNYVVGFTPGIFSHRLLRGEVGQESVSFVSLTSFTQVVAFANNFNSTPSVVTNINSGSGSTSGWDSRAISIGSTQFTLFVFGTVNTWSSVAVNWIAVGD